MKVKHILNDLGDDVKVQIFDSVGNEKRPVFTCSYYSVWNIRNHQHLLMVKKHLDREVDHTEYISAGTERYCKIYMTPETKADEKAMVVWCHSQDILPLDVFLENLNPDTFALLGID